MKSSKKAKIIASSVAAIALSSSLIAGSTFALFTSQSSVNVAVTSAKVNVTAKVDKDTVVKTFAYGDANVADNSVTVNNMLPGDSIAFDIVITNYSTVEVKYNTEIIGSNDALFKALNVSVDGKPFTGEVEYKTNYAPLAAAESEKGDYVKTVKVIISLPAEYDNVYTGEDENPVQGITTNIAFKVNAVQGNVETPVYQAPDGYTAVETAETLVSEIVKGGKLFLMNDVSWSGGTLTLGENVELDLNGKTLTVENGICFGEDSKDLSVKNGTIVTKGCAEGMPESEVEFDGCGLLFNGCADVLFDSVTIESAEPVAIRILVASAEGDPHFNNVTIKNDKSLEIMASYVDVCNSNISAINLVYGQVHIDDSSYKISEVTSMLAEVKVVRTETDENGVIWYDVCDA